MPRRRECLAGKLLMDATTNLSDNHPIAMKNRSVTIGDKLWVDKESRVELEVGGETDRKSVV